MLSSINTAQGTSTAWSSVTFRYAYNLVFQHALTFCNQFDGERDLKTPSDFSSNKADEGGDDDDDDVDDNDAGRAGKKDRPSHSTGSIAKTGLSHSNGSGHGNVPIRPAQPNPQDLARSIDVCIHSTT